MFRLESIESSDFQTFSRGRGFLLIPSDMLSFVNQLHIQIVILIGKFKLMQKRIHPHALLMAIDWVRCKRKDVASDNRAIRSNRLLSTLSLGSPPSTNDKVVAN